ncbi:hypothetical protein PO878_15500 [Iamia majanohamensis]|uniref:Glycosyltransferase RgtA/B/C/D-like domain-containing protein n=1 Tax=Iamia majanohamensis TaxID=467976 RepID=A0AAE9Y488_9ACTN|nr:hypothetical protein [Iamia majanohamensis]WCO65907.1 hypothetical protein PO878_15500 [Iamia majanohamensis]
MAALVVALGAAGATVAAHTPSWHAPFVGDDAEALLWALGSEGPLPRPNPHLRPLTLASLRADHAVAGLDPWAYHLTNIALHLAVGALVAGCASALHRRLRPGAPGSALVGAAVGAVFVLLPTHTEAVSWVIGRSYVLAAAGALGATWVWFRGDGPPRPTARAAASGALLLGLLANEVAITTPFAVAALAAGLAWARPRGERDVRGAVLGTAPLVLVGLAYLALRVLTLGSLGGAYGAEGSYDAGPRLVGRALALVARAVVPGVGPLGWVVAAVVGAVAVGVVVVTRWWRTPGARLAAGAVGAALLAALPGAGLGVSLTSTEGERLAYVASGFLVLALVGPVAAAVDAVGRAPGRRLGAAAVAAVAVVTAAVGLAGIDARWREAGALAGAVHGDRRAFADEGAGAVVLVAPDTLEGAYVGRNALAATTLLEHGWTDPTQVTEVVPVALSAPDATIPVRPVAGADRTWRIDLSGDDVAPAPVPGGGPAFEVEGVAVRRVAADTLQVELGPGVDLSTVWYLSGGRLRPLRPAGG